MSSSRCAKATSGLTLGTRTFVGVFAAPSSVNSMQLSSSALVKIINLTSGANPNYAAAYNVAYNDLKTNYPNATGAEADVIHWLQVAQQVNSGAKKFDPIAIRAVNAIASQYELGKTINLFGLEEQAASNAIAKDFFTILKNNNGTVQTFDHIIQDDALDGVVNTLGLSPAAWAGALPDSVVKCFTGFNTDTYYDTLTSAQKQEADLLHVAAFYITMDELLGEKFGLSQTTIDKIVAANM